MKGLIIHYIINCYLNLRHYFVFYVARNGQRLKLLFVQFITIITSHYSANKT